MQCSRYWLKMTTNTEALGALDSEVQRLVREYDLTRPVKFRHVRWLSLYSFIMCCCQGVCLNLIRSCVCSVTGCEGLPSRHLAWCAWSSRRNMLMCVPSFQIETGLVVFPACFIISDVFRRAWELLTSSWLVVVIDLVWFCWLRHWLSGQISKTSTDGWSRRFGSRQMSQEPGEWNTQCETLPKLWSVTPTWISGKLWK